VAYGSREETTNAIKDLTDAISFTPTFFDAIYLRAQLYMQLDDYKNAIEDLDNALVNVPDPSLRSEIFHKQAVCHTELRLYATANQYFDKAFESTDDHAILFYDKGISLFYQGNIPQAIEAYLGVCNIGGWRKGEIAPGARLPGFEQG